MGRQFHNEQEIGEGTDAGPILNSCATPLLYHLALITTHTWNSHKRNEKDQMTRGSAKPTCDSPTDDLPQRMRGRGAIR